MPHDKERLDVDLTFLDEKKAGPSTAPVNTSYKVNWKNIAIIAGIVAGIGALIIFNDNSSSVSTRARPTSITPTYQPPATYDTDSVNVGQYRCSNSNARQAEQLKPTGELGIDAEQTALDNRADALKTLQAEINASGVSQYSPQFEIDRYNRMIEQYNSRLRSYNVDASSLHAKIDRYNAQVNRYNQFLDAYCVRRGR